MKLPTVRLSETLPQGLNDKIGKLRAATGKPERCELLVFCSADQSMPASVCTFERMHPGEQFKMTGQNKAGGGGQGAATVTTFRAEEFSAFSTTCPYCGVGGRVDCQNCGKRYCQGGTRKERGKELFPCPTCKGTYELTSGGNQSGTITVLKSVSSGPTPAGLLGHVKQGLLPGRRQ